MPIKQTHYGPVDAKVFRRLQDSFETMKVLYALDAIDQIRYDICEPDQMRESFLQLHQMVHHLFNGSPPGGRIEHESVWELADELSITLSGYIEALEPIIELLDKLVDLAPDPDEELEGAYDDEEGDDDDEEEEAQNDV